MSRTLFDVERLLGRTITSSGVDTSRWGKHFSHQNGILLHFAPSVEAHVFLHDGLAADNPEDIAQFFKAEGTVGYIMSCEQEEWRIDVENTAPGIFGIIVYTASGKPYLTGSGRYDAAGKWQVDFSTLFPGIRNGKACHLQGGAKGGTGQKTEVQVGGTCSVNF